LYGKEKKTAIAYSTIEIGAPKVYSFVQNTMIVYYIQAGIGFFNFIILGKSTLKFTMVLQYVGVFASFAVAI
jgi:hypothetical protein